MSSVELANTSSIVVDAPASREWVASFTGAGGQTTIRIPRASRAASATYIHPDGGSLVKVLDDTAGPWSGMVESIVEDGATLELRVVQHVEVLGKRAITREGTLRYLSAGAIVSLVLADVLPGMPGVSLGAMSDGGTPLVPEYRLGGQDALSVVTDMMQRSGQELYINPASGAMWWCGPDAFATAHEALLIAGGNFHGARRQVINRDRVSEVTATNGRSSYTATDGTSAAAGWPGQTTISVPDTVSLEAAATAELEQRSRPVIVVEGSVGPELWGIRERDYVRVLLPWAGFTGRTYCCRVLARRLDEGARLMGLVLQVIPDAVSRVRPVMRVSRDGRAGSFVQRQRQLRRAVTALERGA